MLIYKQTVTWSRQRKLASWYSPSAQSWQRAVKR